MNQNLIFAALRARYRMFFLVLAATVVATTIVGLLVPKTYLAKASLLLDSRDEQTVRNAAHPLPERERLGYLQTQVDILSSPKVARQVVRDRKLAEDPELRAKFAARNLNGTIDDWLAEGILRNLKIDTSQSSIILLSYASDDAQRSAAMANAFAQAYMDTVLELRVDPTRQNSAWFNEQLKGLRENMEQAQSRLARFQRENRIISNDENLDVENIQLAELARQIARANDPEFNLNRRRGAAPTDPEALAAPDVHSLRSELMRAESRLHEMLSDFGPRHPHYLRQSAEVDRLHARLRNAATLAAASSAKAAASLRQNKEKLLGELDIQRERALRQKEARNQMAAYSYDAAVAQRIYETALQGFMTTSIDSRALQTNVRILNPAVPPAKAKSPRLGLNAALAVVMGIMLGLATVYLQEMLDQRVRHLDDLAWDPNVPVLGVLNPWNPAAAARLPGYAGAGYALPAPGTGSGQLS